MAVAVTAYKTVPFLGEYCVLLLRDRQTTCLMTAMLSESSKFGHFALDFVWPPKCVMQLFLLLFNWLNRPLGIAVVKNAPRADYFVISSQVTPM